MAVLGIDLGTANSAGAALLSGTKMPFMIEPKDLPPGGGGDQIYPSYVYFQKDGVVGAVGAPARDKFFYQGQSFQVARHFKRLIGRPYNQVIEQVKHGHRSYVEYEGRIQKDSDGLVKLKVGDTYLPIHQIAAHLIEAIVADAKQQVRGEEITAVTVCLPAGFDDLQRQETFKAARLAGIMNARIDVLEEPTAALIAKGISGTCGTVMVIDVGAGTTDVILGNVRETSDGLRLVALKRACDDLLGGIDMDNLILDYLANHELKEIYPQLDEFSRIFLLGKIEEAKIAVSSAEGTASIAGRFKIQDKPSFLFNYPLSIEKLNEIISPLIWGYTTSLGYSKGIKPTIERVLLDAAGGQKELLANLIKSIDHIVLVGGPCRMKAVHAMLKTLFKDNTTLVAQLDHLDPQDRFFMEGVANGAAISINGNTSITTSMSSTFGVYTHRTGFISGIPEGTPYKRGKGVSRPIEIPVVEGSNSIYTINQKNEQSPRFWSSTQHLVNVPQSGNLKINLVWEEEGSPNTTVSGCGLPEIELPWAAEVFGSLINDGMRQRYEYIKEIGNIKGEIKPALKETLKETGLSDEEAGIAAEKHLYISPDAIEECQNINLDENVKLSEPEMRMMAKEGFYKASDEIIAGKGTSFAEADNLVGKVISLIQQVRTPSTVNELISTAREIISNGEENNSTFGQQLIRWFTLLEAKPENHVYAAATATALSAYVKHLFHKGKLGQEEFDNAESVCWQFAKNS